ncbi:MAG: deoxyribose-phosphate aldolase [Defluviitaleaceae bacterium]|nr:deoxyribose-phosphate aldolase [Defluviitaleaceae bacterium]
MTNEQIFKRIDHTILSPVTTAEQVKKVCEEAIKYNMASACIPPNYVSAMKQAFPSLSICTVIGFPLGYSKSKANETELAIADGADEVDIVINLADVKNKQYEHIETELKHIRKISEGKILKVIIETCYLTEEEKIMLCKIVTECKADYIKTSTGFGTSGANIEDIHLFKEQIGENVKIKASGGIRTKEQFEAFINLGCDRLGASSAIQALLGENTEKNLY